jgi:uncharacterized protein
MQRLITYIDVINITQVIVESLSMPLPPTYTRRQLFAGLGAGLSGLGVAAGGAYASLLEPFFTPRIQHYTLSPPSVNGQLWHATQPLRLVIVADIHAGIPYMNAARIEKIIDLANQQKPDVALLLGDYTSTPLLSYRDVPVEIWTRLLGDFKAPLGTYAILGNADMWDGGKQCRQFLPQMGITLLENTAQELSFAGQKFWLAGLGDQITFQRADKNKPSHQQRIPWADMPRLMSHISSDAPTILLAHEPQIFAQRHERFFLTLSGHTHGGQIRFAGWSPFSQHSFGNRYAYGHIVEEERHLIVSGGLGLSKLPIRFGVPPEITVVDLMPNVSNFAEYI